MGNVIAGRGGTAKSAKGPRAADEQSRGGRTRSAVRGVEPARMPSTGRLQFAAQRGGVYPRAFLDSRQTRPFDAAPSEDFVRRCTDRGVVPRGHPLVRVHFPRCYVDVNWEPYELDPTHVRRAGRPSFANTRSMRVAGGLGTVARVVGDAQEIYDQRIPIDDALRRIEGLYKPYSPRASSVVHPRASRFGAAVLVDCPSPCRPPAPRTTGPRADMRRSATVTGRVASASWRRPSRQVFRELGYAVSRNKPYAGGFITEVTYGNPAAGLHSIQIELNRALYMDERRYERTAGVGRTCRRSRGAGRPAGGQPDGGA